MAKKRAHISDSENDSGSSEEEIEVSVPPFSGEFSSWEAFHEELGRPTSYTRFALQTQLQIATSSAQLQHSELGLPPL
ncbi:unnamed protein product [Phytophthora fragariaefolia]|uniref:Unnamed protein product n=1 Tax=Phytophthora fragariaefolia TaxID=1490495 RepID=A0A9W6X6A9_9STRA|nr:unnamed protein product [Phytophthora fragariaefolia]